MSLPDSLIPYYNEGKARSAQYFGSDWVAINKATNEVSVSLFGREICYINLLSYLQSPSSRAKNRFFVFSPIQPENLAYNDFIINRSWFRDVFLTKDPAACLFEIDTSKSSTEILGGLSALRYFRDGNGCNLSVEDYNFISSIEPDERIAFILWSLFKDVRLERGKPSIPDKRNIMLTKNYNNHSMFDFKEHGILGLITQDKFKASKGDLISREWKKLVPETISDSRFLSMTSDLVKKHSNKVVKNEYYGEMFYSLPHLTPEFVKDLCITFKSELARKETECVD